MSFISPPKHRYVLTLKGICLQNLRRPPNFSDLNPALSFKSRYWVRVVSSLLVLPMLQGAHSYGTSVLSLLDIAVRAGNFVRDAVLSPAFSGRSLRLPSRISQALALCQACQHILLTRSRRRHIRMEQSLSPVSVEKLLRGEFIPCDLFHPRSCEINALKRFLSIFKLAVKVYVPVHLAPLLIFKMKVLLANPGHHLHRVLISIAKSCAFISAFGFLTRYGLCRIGPLFGYGRFTWVMSVIIGSLSLGIETESRRTELALYLLPRALEAGWNMSVARGWIKSLPQGEWVTFAAAMSVLMAFYQTDPNSIKPTYRSIFKVLFGEN